MLNMVEGCVIHDPSVLNECYQSTETGFTANVNAENIVALVEAFIARQEGFVFLILELPTNAKDEVEIEPGVIAQMHVDVFYMDGLTKETAVRILHDFSYFFVHDGMCRFGFGAHSGSNEIMLGKYNIATIYTATPKQYDGMFEQLGIPKVDDIKTAWDYFTLDTPGECIRIERNGKDIYDVAEYLKQYGLYFAERRKMY